MRKIFSLLLFASLFQACSLFQSEVQLSPTSPEFTYMGRTSFSADSLTSTLHWSGASISVNFEGTAIEATLKNSLRDIYYNVILDGDEPFLLRIDTMKQTYLLADNLTEGKHTLQLFRRNECTFGNTSFFGFTLPKGGQLLPADAPKKHSIEFYGNSITAGHGTDDPTNKDRWDSIYTNNYHSYASFTARHFDADYSCIARGGIGIMASWFDQIMPELYYRQNSLDPNSKWDYSKKQYELVVVNLFQNDSWLVNQPNHESFKKRFGEQAPDSAHIVNAYSNFISKLREHYPKAKIICMLGNMDVTRKGSLWPGYVQAATNLLNDNNIYTHFIPYKESKGHPKTADQKKMADSLIKFIEEKLGW